MALQMCLPRSELELYNVRFRLVTVWQRFCHVAYDFDSSSCKSVPRMSRDGVTKTTCKTLNFDGGKPQTIVSAIKLIMIQGVKFMAEAIVYSFILFSLRHKV